MSKRRRSYNRVDEDQNLGHADQRSDCPTARTGKSCRMKDQHDGGQHQGRLTHHRRSPLGRHDSPRCARSPPNVRIGIIEKDRTATCWERRS